MGETYIPEKIRLFAMKQVVKIVAFWMIKTPKNDQKWPKIKFNSYTYIDSMIIITILDKY